MAASAVIEIDGNAGSSQALEVGTPVVLTNQSDTDVSVWAWTLLYRPQGSSAVLDNTDEATTGFTPDVEGSYRIQLVVNAGGPGLIDKRVGSVLTSHQGFRSPALDETDDFGEQGWTPALESFLQNADRDQRAATRQTCIALSSISGPGPVVFTGEAELPNGDIVPTVTSANASTPASCHTIAWATSAAGVDEKVVVVIFGRVAATVSTSGKAVGDPVYLSDASGVVSFTPGSIKRLIGTVLTVGSPGSYYILGGVATSVGTPSVTVEVDDDDYTALPSNEYIAMLNLTDVRTVTLPFGAAVQNGMVLEVKDQSGAAGLYQIRVAPQGSETVDGYNTYKVIDVPYGSLRLRRSSGAWWLV